MTILNNGTRNQYTATNGQTAFSYSFEIFDEDDLVVLNGTTVLVITTDYTVTGAGNNNGGAIALVVGATTGDILTLYRDTAPVRLTDYQQSGDFLAEEVNLDIDRLWGVIQEIGSDQDRSLKFSRVSAAAEAIVADPIEGRTLKWEGDNLVNTDNDIDTIISVSAASADAASSSETNSANSASASQVSRLASGVSATSAQLDAWIAEAEAKTSESYAVEPENVVVKTYSSDGDGTFTATATTDYSALHHAAQANSAVITGTGVTSSYVSSVSAGGTTFNQGAVIGEINSDLIDTAVSYAGYKHNCHNFIFCLDLCLYRQRRSLTAADNNPYA